MAEENRWAVWEAQGLNENGVHYRKCYRYEGLGYRYVGTRTLEKGHCPLVWIGVFMC